MEHARKLCGFTIKILHIELFIMIFYEKKEVKRAGIRKEHSYRLGGVIHLCVFLSIAWCLHKEYE